MQNLTHLLIFTFLIIFQIVALPTVLEEATEPVKIEHESSQSDTSEQSQEEWPIQLFVTAITFSLAILKLSENGHILITLAGPKWKANAINNPRAPPLA